MNYYVCNYEGTKAIHGPWPLKKSLDFVCNHPDATKYSVASRWQLGKIKTYPRNKAGDAALLHDLICENCGHSVIGHMPTCLEFIGDGVACECALYAAENQNRSKKVVEFSFNEYSRVVCTCGVGNVLPNFHDASCVISTASAHRAEGK